MKFSMYVIDDAIQFNLTPETDIETKYMKLLKDYDGIDKVISIHNGVDVTFCQGGQGGFIRDFGKDDKTIAITIQKSPNDQGEAQ